MPKNQLTKDELKVRVLKLKDKLYKEHILGFIMENLLLPMISKIFLVLFILSRIILMVGNILVENIYGVLELLKGKNEK